MKLTEPIDVHVLKVMKDGNYYNPTKVWFEIKNSDHSAKEFRKDYITQRMGQLRDMELLQRVPPENSGLYQITEYGSAALEIYNETGKSDLAFTDLLQHLNDKTDSE